MTEPTELNLDAWLDGVQRAERSVTLYGRADVLADIDQLEAKLRALPAEESEDRSYGETSGRANLEQQIDALYLELDKSKMVFRVSFLDDTEQNEIHEQVKKDLKDEADKAAAEARKEARDKCHRLEITAANDINSVLRTMANAAADAVIDREVNIRTIAAAVVSPKLTLDQVRKLYTRVGDAQIGLLSRAYTRVSNEAPQVAVPKSSKPSQTGDGAMSS